MVFPVSERQSAHMEAWWPLVRASYVDAAAPVNNCSPFFNFFFIFFPPSGNTDVLSIDAKLRYM